jgi:hypothetical protein
MEELNQHIHATWKKYIRKQRSERKRQIVPLAFIVECNGVVTYDKESFYQHAYDQGATLQHELEFVGSPVFVPGMDFLKTYQKNLERMRFLCSLKIRHIEGSGCWYYPIEQIVWTSHKNLSRRKTMPNLTTHGIQHWKSGLITKIKAWGEMKSVNAWSTDRRALVSDKIIKRRIDVGWTPEAAISTPAGMKNHPT